MKRMNVTYYEYTETYEEIRTHYYDDAYSTYEESYISRYDMAACYDNFTGMTDELVEEMELNFSLRVSVACF